MIEITNPKIDRTKLAVVLITVLVIILIVILILSRNMDGIREFLLRSGKIGLVISVGLYGVLGASPIPSEPLTVLLSALYGPFYITIVATLGNLLSALVEYYIGRKIGDVSDFERRRQKLPFNLGKIPGRFRDIPDCGPLPAGLWRQVHQRPQRHLSRALVALYLDDGPLNPHRRGHRRLRRIRYPEPVQVSCPRWRRQIRSPGRPPFRKKPALMELGGGAFPPTLAPHCARLVQCR